MPDIKCSGNLQHPTENRIYSGLFVVVHVQPTGAVEICTVQRVTYDSNSDVDLS